MYVLVKSFIIISGNDLAFILINAHLPSNITLQ